MQEQSIPPIASPRPLTREVLRLAWPVVAESLMGTLAQMVDIILVSPLGAVAVAAVGLSTQPLWFLMGPFFGLAAGVGALVARLVGGRDLPGARAAGRQALWLGASLGLLMGGLIFWQAESIIRLMGGQPEVIPGAAAYLRALAPGLGAFFLSIVLGAVPRAGGDTRTPFYISVGVNLLNLVLTWGLIYGHWGLPALGLVGAGVATSIARVLGLIALLAAVMQKRARVRLEFSGGPGVDTGLIRRILNVGVPAAGERVATSLAYVIYSRLVSTLGTVTVAAHYTAVIAENISWFVGMGLTTAAATLVGQALGAGMPERASAAIRAAVRIGLIVTVPLTLLFLLLPEPYLWLFSRDGEVVSLGAQALRVAAAGEGPMILSLVFMGALTGAGDSRSVALISLAGGWLVRLGFAALFVLGFGWGLPGAWAASVLDWSVRIGLLHLRFRSGRWQQARV